MYGTQLFVGTMDDCIIILKGINLENAVSWYNANEIAEACHIRKLSVSVERSFVEADFSDCVPLIEKNLRILESLLKGILEENIFKHVEKLESHVKSFVVSSLIVCGEQCSEEVWTSNSTIELAKDVLILLCRIFRVENEYIFLEFETKWNTNLCKLFLNSLKNKLQKQVWKQYPAGFKCFRWFLFQLKYSQITEHIEDILPPSLMAVDDFEKSHQILGIICLSHIIENVNRTDLCSLGYDDVIYNALEPLIYEKEPEIVSVLMPCIIKFLQKVEKGYTRKEDDLQFTRYDKVMKLFLSNMEMEQYLSRRKVYIGILPTYLDSMGISMVRWSKRLIRIFEDYLFADDGSEGDSTKLTLEAFKVYILNTWPLIPNKMDKVLELLLKLLIDMCDLDNPKMIPNDTLEEIMTLIEDCLSLVVKISPSKAQELCAGLKESYSNDKFDKVIHKAFLYDKESG